MGFCNCSVFCCALLCVHSSFAIISIGKRERAGCFALSVFLVGVIVVWLFLTMPWVCLQFVIVVFADHTHLLFSYAGFASGIFFSIAFIIHNESPTEWDLI